LMSTLLPHPLLPIMAIVSPVLILRFIPCKTFFSSKLLCRFSISIIIIKTSFQLSFWIWFACPPYFVLRKAYRGKNLKILVVGFFTPLCSVQNDSGDYQVKKFMLLKINKLYYTNKILIYFNRKPLRQRRTGETVLKVFTFYLLNPDLRCCLRTIKTHPKSLSCKERDF